MFAVKWVNENRGVFTSSGREVDFRTFVDDQGNVDTPECYPYGMDTTKA